MSRRRSYAWNQRQLWRHPRFYLRRREQCTLLLQFAVVEHQHRSCAAASQSEGRLYPQLMNLPGWWAGSVFCLQVSRAIVPASYKRTSHSNFNITVSALLPLSSFLLEQNVLHRARIMLQGTLIVSSSVLETANEYMKWTETSLDMVNGDLLWQQYHNRYQRDWKLNACKSIMAQALRFIPLSSCLTGR
jgi:hypothetical protein